MKKKGTIQRWNTLSGMGSIRSPRISYDIFFHIKDYRGSALPREGETVWFDEITARDTRPRAIEVSTVSGNAHVHSHRPRRYIGRKSGTGSFVLLLCLWIILAAWGIWDDRLPSWTVAAVIGLNVLTIMAYARDPQGARPGHWRMPETLLHLLSLLGGWPSAGMAQTILQYRSRNPSFATRYWSTVAVHFAVLLGWLFWFQPKLGIF